MTIAPTKTDRIHYVSDQIISADNHALFTGATVTVSQSSINSILYADRSGASTVPNPTPLNSAGQIDVWVAAAGTYTAAVTYTKDNGSPQTDTYTFVAGSSPNVALAGDASGTATAVSVDKIKGTSEVARTAWTAVPTLQNSWANKATYAAAKYSIDNLGLVHLRGVIDSGTKTAGTLITTLPAGARPLVKEVFVVTHTVAATTDGAGTLIIDIDGTVKVGEVDLTASSYISLSGICFDTVA